MSIGSLTRKIFRGLGTLLFFIAALILLYGMWSLFAYRDISAEDLHQQYGGNVQQVYIDGVNLHYRLDGLPIEPTSVNDTEPTSQAPIVLLIHNHYFNSLMWDGWVAEMQDQFSIIRYDLTSHGFTGPEPNSDYSIERDSFLIEALLAHLGVNKAAIVGSSLGGNIAFYYTAKHPEQVSHLVLVNSGGLKRKQSSGRNAEAIPDWFYKVLYFVPRVAWRSFIEWMAENDAVVTNEVVQQFHSMLRREGNRKAEMRRMASFKSGEPDQILAEITAPVLIQWGEQNPQLPASSVESFKTRLVRSQKVESKIYAGAGHLLPLELPEASAADAAQFIKDE